MDSDNIVAIKKPTIDQLCKMGFIVNDRDVSWGEVTSVYGGKKGSTLRNTTVDNVQGYALYATGDLTVADSKVSNTTSTPRSPPPTA